MLGLPAPEITVDPLRFLAKHLRASLLSEETVETEADIYTISGVIRRVEIAAEREMQVSEAVESALEQVRDALRRSQYKEAIDIGVGIPWGDWAPLELSELMAAMWLAAVGLFDNSEKELEGYRVGLLSETCWLSAVLRL
jgi:hypothetical protein